jgi:hypothetical protein
MKQLVVGMAVIAVLAACARPHSRAPNSIDSVSFVPLATSNAFPTSTAVLTATPSPALVARCVRAGDTAFAGVADVLPDGWSELTEIAALSGFPKTFERVDGPEGATVPPDEGPGRLALFETFPASNAYFKSRIELSRKRHGKPIAVTICGEATAVWLDESTGELLVGWTDRNKSDVMVVNTADFTVQGLVDSAEGVYDCCG